MCGSDGITYSNECELVARACTLGLEDDLYAVSYGECSEIATTSEPETG